MRLTRVSLSLGLLITPALLACRQNPLVQPANPAPKAVAVANPATYPQAPATVTLDATGSTDDNGSIATYQWFSATAKPNGEPGRLVPEGQSLNWPDDKPTVSVELPEGIWTFGLWVTDDQGVTGAPGYVTVTVGDPPAPAAGSGGAAPAGGAGGS
jgi:hypothetical protein